MGFITFLFNSVNFWCIYLKIIYKNKKWVRGSYAIMNFTLQEYLFICFMHLWHPFLNNETFFYWKKILIIFSYIWGKIYCITDYFKKFDNLVIFLIKKICFFSTTRILYFFFVLFETLWGIKFNYFIHKKQKKKSFWIILEIITFL